jgi:hypothetical protein
MRRKCDRKRIGRNTHKEKEKKSSCVRKFSENSLRHPIINNRPLGLAVDEKSIIRWICDKNGMKIHGGVQNGEEEEEEELGDF